MLWGPNPAGVRRLVALVLWLPADGAFHRALNPEGWAWRSTEELLATLLELTDLGNRMYFQAHAKEGTLAPDPIEIRRPKLPEEAAPPMSILGHMKRLFNR